MTEPDTEPEADAASNRAPFVLAVTLAVVFAVAAAILAVIAVGGTDADDRSDALRRTAGEFGEALVTYDYREPEAHREEVLSYATGAFRDEYEEAFDQGLGKLITQVEATSQGFVKDVYLSEIDEERAQAVVVVDIEHDGTGGPRTLYDVYFRVTFVEVDDTWKVDDVTDLNFDTGGAAPRSTTTSIP